MLVCYLLCCGRGTRQMCVTVQIKAFDEVVPTASSKRYMYVAMKYQWTCIEYLGRVEHCKFFALARFPC